MRAIEPIAPAIVIMTISCCGLASIVSCMPTANPSVIHEPPTSVRVSVPAVDVVCAALMNRPSSCGRGFEPKLCRLMPAGLPPYHRPSCEVLP